MKSSKKFLEQFAKTLYKKSLTNGQLDEKKIKLIIAKLTSQKPAGLSSILKTYKRLVAHKLTTEQIIIETNDKIIPQKSYLENLKKKTGAKVVINKVNNNLVFGAKIYHGDWEIDDTLEGKLKQLTTNIQ